jgi:hypothetical protein
MVAQGAWKVALVVGVISIVALAMILIAMPGMTKIDIDIAAGRISAEAPAPTQISTNVGSVPIVQDSRNDNEFNSIRSGIYGNTVINKDYGFTISVPNTIDWTINNDENDLYQIWGDAMVPGEKALVEIFDNAPDADGYYHDVLVVIDDNNFKTAKQNMKELREILPEGFSALDIDMYDINTYEDPDHDAAVLSYYTYGCYDFEGLDDCYETLHLETFFKVDNTLYNVRGTVNPSVETGDKAPEKLTDDLFNLMNSFTLI